MKVGYVRIGAQDTEAEQRFRRWQQAEAMDRGFIDRAEGKELQRPELQYMMELVQTGDCVCTMSFARLAISLKDLLHILQQLKEKNVRVIAVREGFDTANVSGRVYMEHIEALAAFEQEVQEERQSAGIEAARAEGRYKGRVPKERPDNWYDLVSRLHSKEIPTIVDLAQRCQCSRPTIYRWMKEDREMGKGTV